MFTFIWYLSLFFLFFIIIFVNIPDATLPSAFVHATEMYFVNAALLMPPLAPRPNIILSHPQSAVGYE